MSYTPAEQIPEQGSRRLGPVSSLVFSQNSDQFGRMSAITDALWGGVKEQGTVWVPDPPLSSGRSEESGRNQLGVLGRVAYLFSPQNVKN
jgi:hypothetical protein